MQQPGRCDGRRPGHGARRSELGERDSRKIGDGEEGIRIEDVGFDESLQQVPRHWATCARRSGRTVDGGAGRRDGVGGKTRIDIQGLGWW